jgi:hypothetical protein
MGQWYGTVSFVWLCASLLPLFYSGYIRKTQPLRARKWDAWMLLSMSLAGLFFSLNSLYQHHKSPQPELTGKISNLRQFFGKYPGSSFTVTFADGSSAALNCSYNGPALTEGDNVRVHFVQYDGLLLSATMLTGPYAGWHCEESDETWAILGFVAFSVVGLFGSRYEFKKSRPATMQADRHKMRALKAKPPRQV